MTHTPAVPPASQSPFPLQEAPHEHPHGFAPPRFGADEAKRGPWWQEGPTLGIAAGLGAAVMVGAYLFVRGKEHGADGRAAPRPRRAPAKGDMSSSGKKPTQRRSTSPETASAAASRTRRKRATNERASK